MDNIVIKDARIMFRNFSGSPSKFNREGDRNFALVIPEESMAIDLTNAGWNVKRLEPREEGDDPTYYIQVAVKYDNASSGFVPPKKRRNPKIVLIDSHGQKKLISEEVVGEFDNADFERIDVSVRPYNWEMNGMSGVKAYLKTMYVTLRKDEFEDDYPDTEDDPF